MSLRGGAQGQKEQKWVHLTGAQNKRQEASGDALWPEMCEGDRVTCSQEPSQAGERAGAGEAEG